MFFCFFFFQYCVGRWSICDTVCDILCVYGHPAVNLLNSLVDRYCLSKRPGLWFRHWIKWGFFSNELSRLSFIGNPTLIVLSEIWALLSICLESNPQATMTWILTFMAFKNFVIKILPQKCLHPCLGVNFFLLKSVAYKCIIQVIDEDILSVKEKGSLQVWWGRKLTLSGGL